MKEYEKLVFEVFLGYPLNFFSDILTRPLKMQFFFIDVLPKNRYFGGQS